MKNYRMIMTGLNRVSKQQRQQGRLRRQRAMRILKLVIISLFVMSISSLAKSEVTCKNIIAACDAALEAKEVQLNMERSYSQLLLDNSIKLDKKITEQQEDLGRWYRNPWTVGGAGVLLGIVAAGFVGFAK
jgi:hypothetical protein